LLLNILPAETAQELQKNGEATPRYYDSVSVMFTDFKDFTVIAGTLSPQQLVAELNSTFIAFDDIIEKHHLEKIKTVGDAYMCAGGIPTVDTEHSVNTIEAGLAIRDFMAKGNEERLRRGAMPWNVRIGIHTGPLVAGVVGKKKFAYDIWGDTVNVASRMETNGEIGKVNISASTYALVKDKYKCFHRGKISAKNVGDVDMYFVEGAV
jgi:adenylate cyclase